MKRSLCETAAYHEAGHVVAAVLARIPIKDASIQPLADDERGTYSLGRVNAEVALLRWSDERPLTPEERECYEAYFRMLMAGPIAECRHTGQWHGAAHNKSDYEMASVLLVALGNNGVPREWDDDAWLAYHDRESTGAYRHVLVEQAINLITAFWHAVEHVAHALMDTSVIDGEALVRLVHAARPSRTRWPHAGWGMCVECRGAIKAAPRRARKQSDPAALQLALFEEAPK